MEIFLSLVVYRNFGSQETCLALYAQFSVGKVSQSRHSMILFFYIEVDNIVEMMYDPARKCAGFFSFNHILIISWKGGNG